MNSEKVKEIKKGLECCKQNEIEDTCKYCLDCPASDWDYEKECKIDLFQKTITLINELESENERLKTQLAQANAGIVNCSGCKLVELNAVKEFAEKLKNNCAYSVILELKYTTEKRIDELLKEYTK